MKKQTSTLGTTKAKRAEPRRGYYAKAILAAGGFLLSLAAQAQVAIFQENFSSGLGQFTATGTVNTSSGAAVLQGCLFCPDGTIVSSPISTTGFNSIRVSYDRTATGLDFRESGSVDYSINGGAWTSLESVRTAAGRMTFSLPAAAANTSIRLRWAISASLSRETFAVDNIVVDGVSGDPGPGPGPGPGGTIRGPDPTKATLEASTGPFSVGSTVVTRSAASGYGGGTIYYPTNTTEGPFALVSVTPGYTAAQSTIQTWGPRLASWGFVVITIDTNSTSDYPDSRATQMVKALDQVVSLSKTSGHPTFGKVDSTRLGVMGWSMGGGGSLIALKNNPTKLKAGIPLAPWAPEGSTNFSTVAQPVLIFAGQSDTIAPTSEHALPYYNSIPSTRDKAFAEISGGDHSSANNPANKAGVIGKYGVAWMKRFLDNDTRFSPFLCDAPHQADLSGNTFSRYMETCPY